VIALPWSLKHDRQQQRIMFINVMINLNAITFIVACVQSFVEGGAVQHVVHQG